VDDRAPLLARYRELVLDELPRRARAERWVVTADHCFGRIVLDHAVGGRWYDVLDRRRAPAFTQLDDAQLRAAVDVAERISAEGDPLLRELDAQSLRWRGKAAKPAPRGTAEPAPRGATAEPAPRGAAAEPAPRR
jgi:hypothetical protein